MPAAQIIDSPIINLNYETQTINGVTDENGYFNYSSDDKNVTFKIGELKIATFDFSKLNKDKKIFVGELFGLDRNNTTNENLINLLRFLQSLDEDNNPDNGIKTTDEEKENINNLIDLNDTIKPDFSENNITVLEYITKKLNKKFVLVNEARDNYAKTLEKYEIKPTKMPFTMLWEIKDDKTIKIPINPNYTGEYNYTVDWGDGNISTDINDTISHTYSKDGNYTVKISGKFPAIYLNCNYNYDNFIDDDAGGSEGPGIDSVSVIGGSYAYIGSYLEKLIEVKKWGNIEWKSFHHAFACATNLKIDATDTPNLKNVKDMSGAFIRVNEMPDNLGDWDVSNVEDMSYLFMGYEQCEFEYAYEYPTNKNSIGKWDVKNVKNMKYMFVFNTFFNADVSDWNVSNVTNMEGLFDLAVSFNQPLNNWDVSNVTNMRHMFLYAQSFNQPLDQWDVSKVTNMEWMFEEACYCRPGTFDQNVSMWNVSNVTNDSYFATGAPIDGTDKMPHFK